MRGGTGRSRDSTNNRCMHTHPSTNFIVGPRFAPTRRDAACITNPSRRIASRRPATAQKNLHVVSGAPPTVRAMSRGRTEVQFRWSVGDAAEDGPSSAAALTRRNAAHADNPLKSLTRLRLATAPSTASTTVPPATASARLCSVVVRVGDLEAALGIPRFALGHGVRNRRHRGRQRSRRSQRVVGGFAMVSFPLDSVDRRECSLPRRSPLLSRVVAMNVNGGRKSTPFRRLKVDPLGVHSSGVDPGTLPRSRSLMR